MLTVHIRLLKLKEMALKNYLLLLMNPPLFPKKKEPLKKNKTEKEVLERKEKFSILLFQKVLA